MDAQRMENHRLAMERLCTYMTTRKYWDGATATDKKRIRNQSKRHKIKDGVLIYVSITGEETEVITSIERVADILEKYHTSQVAGGHSGIEATIQKITSLYRWGSVKDDVIYYIKRCPVCQTQRSSTSPVSFLTRPPLPGSHQKAPKTINKRALSPRDDEELSSKMSKLQPAEVSDMNKLSSSTVLSKLQPAEVSETNKLSSSTVLSPRSSASSQSVVQPVKPEAGHPGPVRPSAQSNVSLARRKFALPSRKTGAGKKWPPWNFGGRLKDIEYMLGQQEARTNSHQSQLESHNKRIAHLELRKEQLSGDVAHRDELSQVGDWENAELQRQRNCREEMDTVRSKHQQEIEDLTYSKLYLERQYATLKEELKASRTEVSALESSVAHLTISRASVDAELATTKLSLEQAFGKIQAYKEVIQQLKLELAGHDATIDENNRKIREHETMRCKLQNTIQELKKGNIRVFCRVRPLLVEEMCCTDGVIHHMNFPDPEGRVLELDMMEEMAMNESTLLACHREGNKYKFCFDRVFRPESSQEEVFKEISQLVQSALDGYNVSIFAYGQTGSGKTYTIEGCREGDNVGMILRAVRQILKSAAELKDKGWKYKFQASYVEIYNETLQDLLSNRKDTKLKIKLTGKDNVVTVTNLTTVTVSSEKQIQILLQGVNLRQSLAEVKCNERSSRSHSVFQLQLTGSNSITMESCHGTLNFVDLAGSEQLKDFGSEGQRLEAQSINKSLSTLENVIMALSNKDRYILNSNSKLTYLLQKSLGGNSQTVVFVNISPEEDNFSETLNSLQFATKVNQCNVGIAQTRSK